MPASHEKSDFLSSDRSSLSGSFSHWPEWLRPLKLLGQGNFGEVYLAVDQRSSQQIAIKQLLVEQPAPDSFFRRLSTLVSLSHPNLVPLLWYLQLPSHILIAMQPVGGTPLVDAVRADSEKAAKPGAFLLFGQPVTEEVESVFSPCTPDSINLLRECTRPLASALQTLHDSAIVHGDISPQNVLLMPNGFPMILDTMGFIVPNTEEQSFLGTAANLPPEAADSPIAQPSWDHYALGVLLFEALTGGLPFSGTAHEVLLRKRSIKAPRPSFLVKGVPDDLDDLCDALLDRNIQRRSAAFEKMLLG